MGLIGCIGRHLPQRPPNHANVPPPPTGTYVGAQRPNVRWGGRDLRPRRTSQRQVGEAGRCTSTLGRYVGNVRWRGPTFPLQRAFTTEPPLEPPGTHWNHPGTTLEPPWNHPEPPRTTLEQPGTTLEPPRTTLEPPGTTLEPPGTTPGTTWNLPGTAQNHPGTTWNHPGDRKSTRLNSSHP